jgi:hypothetical protein
MFIDHEELRRRLQTNSNLINALDQKNNASSIENQVDGDNWTIRRSGPGRHIGDRNRSVEERSAIGVLGHMIGIPETSRISGASNSQVHSHMNGYNTCANRNYDEELNQNVKRDIGKVRDTAINRMLSTMGFLDDNKLEKVAKATDLASIAASLGKVAQLGLPKESPATNVDNRVQIVVYGPQTKDESKYDSIDV